jgi:hypothetical protein
MNERNAQFLSALRGRVGKARRLPALLLMGWVAVSGAFAAENGGSVYPAGVETVIPGMLPPPGKTILEQFNDFYQANGLMDGNGHSLVPGFHLRVAAVALKVVHNWGVHALGGTLVSSVGLPVLYEHLSAPFGKAQKSGLSNPDIGVLDIAYNKGPWHWWYGVDAFTPGASYRKDDLINIGQHHYAVAPVGAFTYLPHGMTEVSVRTQYIVNFIDGATQYRSGHELISDFAVMQNVTRRFSVGLNGYHYQQTTDDVQNGVAVSGGNRGRALAVGPQIKYHFGKVAVILKYQKDTLVENRAAGNAFWCEIGVPLWRPEK